MRGMAGGERSLPKVVGPSKPEVLLPICGRPMGELLPEDALEEIVGRTGGSSGPSSAMRLMEFVREFFRYDIPFTGLELSDLLVAATVLSGC